MPATFTLENDTLTATQVDGGTEYSASIPLPQRRLQQRSTWELVLQSKIDRAIGGESMNDVVLTQV